MRNTLAPAKEMREVYPPLGERKNKGGLYICVGVRQGEEVIC